MTESRNASIVARHAHEPGGFIGDCFHDTVGLHLDGSGNESDGWVGYVSAPTTEVAAVERAQQMVVLRGQLGLVSMRTTK